MMGQPCVSGGGLLEAQGGGLGAGGGGRQVEEGRGAVNRDENHQRSPDVSVLQRETVSQPQEGKALDAELKEDIFPEL